MTETFCSDILRFAFHISNNRSSTFSGDKFVRLTVKMDQFEIRESVPLEQCSCYSGGGDVSVVVLITSTDVVRSTEYGQCSTQYTERIF